MEQRIGPQSIDITGDTAFITMVDEVLAEDMAVLLAALDTVGGGDGPFYILADIRRLRILPPPAGTSAWFDTGPGALSYIADETSISIEPDEMMPSGFLRCHVHF